MDFNLLSSADLQGFPFSSFNKNRVSLDLTFLLSQSVVTAFTNVAVALKPFRFWDTVFWLVTFVFGMVNSSFWRLTLINLCVRYKIRLCLRKYTGISQQTNRKAPIYEAILIVWTFRADFLWILSPSTLKYFSFLNGMF